VNLKVLKRVLLLVIKKSNMKMFYFLNKIKKKVTNVTFVFLILPLKETLTNTLMLNIKIKKYTVNFVVITQMIKVT